MNNELKITTTVRPDMTNANLVSMTALATGHVMIDYRLADGRLVRGIKSLVAPNAMVEWVEADSMPVLRGEVA